MGRVLSLSLKIIVTCLAHGLQTIASGNQLAGRRGEDSGERWCSLRITRALIVADRHSSSPIRYGDGFPLTGESVGEWLCWKCLTPTGMCR